MAEKVHHYFSYDGETELPEEGVADLHGQPHYFWLRQDLPSRTGLFDVAPVDSEMLDWVRELAVIWHEWDTAYHAGKVELTTHPGHVGNNPRYAELSTKVEQRALVLGKATKAIIGIISTSADYLEEIRKFAGKKWPVPGTYSEVLEVTWREAI